MLSQKYGYYQSILTGLVNLSCMILFIPAVQAQPYPDGSKPKFFICPVGMTRFATYVTTQHDLNLCGQEDADATVLAMRVRRQQKVLTVDIINNQNEVYTARSANGTVYKLDTKNRVFTIKPKSGKVIIEKIIASD
ncbi:hypothetical protein B6N60_05107 [Richelia sinica FACHB-800]|uniref:Uncharacterized protein n=1 Tax=Richelia sinica FACHB-800 TaxID=1357546 RepID=A0A975TCN8_9NOST|nr:hypothetical protein [Richelia sinica]MBD2663904.1 hypothetical protein [Richelia sinica FACHB-800]QXE26376.1 hypothetical protein B6N60_05107 [Richelia sinica FACHB-800]